MFDAQLSVTVPGGLPFNQSIERLVTFKSINGELEQAIASIDKNGNQPARVTEILSLALDKIGNFKINREMTSRMCVADRQFLMLQLAVLFEGDHMWLQVDCNRCDQVFDVELKRSELPIKSAGKNYPNKQVTIDESDYKIRILNGFDQERLSKSPQSDLLKQVLSYCLSLTDGKPVSEAFINELTDKELEALDSELDEIAPAICDQIQVSCPECGQEQTAYIDHYEVTGIKPINFYSEVHQLASHYHWSENEILQLSRNKRRLYLKLIDQSQGMME